METPRNSTIFFFFFFLNLIRIIFLAFEKWFKYIGLIELNLQVDSIWESLNLEEIFSEDILALSVKCLILCVP